MPPTAINMSGTQNNRQPDAPAPEFPPASAFSLLPDVYTLLSRLAPLQNAGSTSTSNGAGAGAGASSDTLHLTLSNEPALQPADIAAAMYPIRQKVQKAIASIKALPDVDRTLEEQEAEIRLLESQIGALCQRLAELADRAGGGRRRSGGVEDGKNGER
ncbi:hypothetical protein DV738_g595, partial [Chaetothyriales sp. CBS 135597]